MGTTDRVLLRIVGAPVVRRLLPAYGALLLGVGLADPMVDWQLLRAHVVALGTASRTGVALILLAAWCATVARAMAPVWQAPEFGFLLRQPISPWRWQRLLVATLLPAVAPAVLGVWWLMGLATPAAVPGTTSGPMGMVALAGLVGSAMLLAVAGTCRGRTALLWQGLAVGLGAALTVCTVTLDDPIGTTGALLLATLPFVALPRTLPMLHRQRARTRNTAGGSLRAYLPVLAVVRRDGLCLWRFERARLWLFPVLAVLAAAFLIALRVNGCFGGKALFHSACLLQTVALTPLFETLERLRTRLGAELVRQHWPLTMAQRAMALLLVAALLAAPAALLIGAAGAAMGPIHLAAFGLYTTTTLAMQCTLFAATAQAPAAAYGWSLWVLVVHGVVVHVLSPGVYLILSAVSLPAALALLRRGLQHLAGASARALLEQPEGA